MAAAPTYQTYRRQVNVPAGDHLAFAAGHGYYDAPGLAHPAAAAPADPYAAIIASLPHPISGAQITRQANAEISPLLAAVTGQIGRQTQAATHAIGGFTADAASKLGAIDFAAPYQQGEQGQAAVDAALRQSLAGAGSQGADQLAQRLAVINDPSVAQAAHALAANGVANGNTQLAQGSASLGNLIANAASAADYGQKQPGITRLAGLQQIAVAGQQGQAAIAAKAAELEAQLPSIIQNLQARNDARSSAIGAARQNQLARHDAIASSAASLTEKAAATDATNRTRLAIAQANADGKATAAQVAQARSDRAYRLQYAKTFGYDPVTGNTLPGYTRNAAGNVVKVGKAGAGKTTSLTALNALAKSWYTGTSTKQPVLDAKTGKPVTNAAGAPVYMSTPTGPVDYQKAYKMLRRQPGVNDVTARQVLDTYYKRGEYGRAWLTNEEQAALKSYGRYAPAQVYQGHGYITMYQADGLSQAKMLPAGEQGLIDGKPVYFIKPV